MLTIKSRNSSFLSNLSSPPYSDENSHSFNDIRKNIEIDEYEMQNFKDRDETLHDVKTSSANKIKSPKFRRTFSNLLKNSKTKNSNFNKLVKKKKVFESKERNYPEKVEEEVINEIYCGICNKVITNPLKQHLFFGPVECTKCHLYLSNCSTYTLAKARYERLKTLRKCEHYYEFVDDPMPYLNWIRVNNLKEENNSTGYFKSKLRAYLRKLRNLEKENPWDTPIKRCYQYLKEETLNEGNNSSAVFDYTSENELLDCAETKIKQKNDQNISLPSDGKYLILKSPIEECPNCYTELDITQMFFDLKNELISIKCTSCGLIIYFVLFPPDGSKPKIQVFEDED